MVYDKEILEKLRAREDDLNARKVEDFVTDVVDDVYEYVSPCDLPALRSAAWMIVEFIFILRGNTLLWRTSGDVRRFLEGVQNEEV